LPLFLNFPHRQFCFVSQPDIAPSVIIQFICADQKLGQVRVGILALVFGAKILYYKFARWKKKKEREAVERQRSANGKLPREGSFALIKKEKKILTLRKHPNDLDLR